MSLPFTGLSAFPITPADEAGRVDAEALTAVLERLVVPGVDSIGLLGSTGAYAFLSRTERQRAVDTALASVAGKVPVIVGVSAMRTDQAATLARDAREAGADGLLLAPMSYTPLTETEVYEHFKAVALAGKIPLCIYNNPSTTRFTFSAGLIAKLSRVEHINAVKMPLPADGKFVKEISDLRGSSAAGFLIGYSGDWGAVDAMLSGADAWYSVAGGLLPVQAASLKQAALAGDMEEAERIDATFMPLWDLFKEFGSFRVMYAMASCLGLGAFVPPRPVLPMPETHLPRLRAALEQLSETGPR